MDLNAAKDDSNLEVQAKIKLAQEKEQIQMEYNELKEKFKVIRTYRSWMCLYHYFVQLGYGRSKQAAISGKGRHGVGAPFQNHDEYRIRTYITQAYEERDGIQDCGIGG